MTMHVELKSPYGIFTAPDGQQIENGRRGFKTGELQGQKPYVKFERHKTPMPVPIHWLHSPKRRKAK